MYEPRPPYPPDWFDVAEAARIRAAHRCVRCGMQGLTPDRYDAWQEPANRAILLEVHHIDGDPANCAEENLEPLCHRCHLHAHAAAREKRKREEAIAAGQQTL